MATLIHEAKPQARIPHQCDMCSRIIQPDENYTRQRLVDCGDAWTWKGCQQCTIAAAWYWAQASDLMHDDSGDSWDIQDQLIDMDLRHVADLLANQWRDHTGTLIQPEQLNRELNERVDLS